LSEQEIQKYGDQTVSRAFGMLSAVDENQKSKSTKAGFNRLAATDYSRDAWVTILSRLATRAAAGLDDPEADIKDEYAMKSAKGSFHTSEAVRDGLYKYIILDWKKRLDLAISWLNEEWYNDTILDQAPPKGNYQRCALRMFDGISGLIEGSDKSLLRFLSEIPALDHAILSRLKDIVRIAPLHHLTSFRFRCHLKNFEPIPV
jgi:symplekin